MKLKLSESEVSLRVQFDEIFGRNIEDESLRVVVGDEMVNIITQRTLSGRGVESGRVVRFPPYTKKYAALVGKSVNQVDLEISGEMLNSIEVIETTSKYIDIGILGNQAPKAHGHMTGFAPYGGSKGPGPRRSFLGLTKADLQKIKTKYKSDVEKIKKVTAKNFMGETQTSDITREDILSALSLLKKGKIGF